MHIQVEVEEQSGRVFVTGKGQKEVNGLLYKLFVDDGGSLWVFVEETGNGSPVGAKRYRIRLDNVIDAFEEYFMQRATR